MTKLLRDWIQDSPHRFVRDGWKVADSATGRSKPWRIIKPNGASLRAVNRQQELAFASYSAAIRHVNKLLKQEKIDQ